MGMKPRKKPTQPKLPPKRSGRRKVIWKGTELVYGTKRHIRIVAVDLDSNDGPCQMVFERKTASRPDAWAEGGGHGMTTLEKRLARELARHEGTMPIWGTWQYHDNREAQRKAYNDFLTSVEPGGYVVEHSPRPDFLTSIDNG